jgi:hypothetical protein
MNPRMARIVEGKPSLITVKGIDGEVKTIDFDKLLALEKNGDSNIFSSENTWKDFVLGCRSFQPGASWFDCAYNPNSRSHHQNPELKPP